MIIAIITGIFPPDIGGPASYVPRIASALEEDGHHVHVLCLSDSTDHDETCYPFKVTRIKRKVFKPYRWLKTIYKIHKLAKMSDIVYVNGLSFESSLALLFNSKPTVHKVVGDYSWERAQNKGWFNGTFVEYQTAKKGFKLKTLDWIRNYPLYKANKIVVPSGYLKKTLISWGINEQKISVVYNATKKPTVNSIYKPAPYSTIKTLVTVCRLIHLKRVDGIILVLAEIPMARLLIVGDGPARRELEDLSVKLGVNDRVVFVGQVSEGSIAGYLKQADCFVLNSTHEGLPHVILEAMENGVPVVATDVGGISEIIENNKTGKLIPPEDTKALREAIYNIITNEEEAKRLSKGAKEMVHKKFSYENMIKQTEEILQSVIYD